MARKSYTAEEIVAKLRQVDMLMAQGRQVADAVRAIGVTDERSIGGESSMVR
jgi:putative transposase